jgi:hypothetical protein
VRKFPFRPQDKELEDFFYSMKLSKREQQVVFDAECECIQLIMNKVDALNRLSLHRKFHLSNCIIAMLAKVQEYSKRQRSKELAKRAK